MKILLRVMAVAIILFSVSRGSVLAQDLEAMMNSFYSGLSVIIEGNMDNPEECVKKVGEYYLSHQAEVDQIRVETKKAMDMIAPQLDKYMSMSEEEAKALAVQQPAEAEGAGARGRELSAAAQRYAEVVNAFSVKYPKYGMQVAGMALKLVPGFDTQQGE